MYTIVNVDIYNNRHILNSHATVNVDLANFNI